jgi:hypothetical protein
MRWEGIFARFALYGVLVCREHRCAVYGLDEHLKRHHRNTSISKRRELLALYEDLHRLPTEEVVQPAPYGLPIDALGPAQDTLCNETLFHPDLRRQASATAQSRAQRTLFCTYFSSSVLVSD